MARFLGIDIGDGSLRGVLIRSGLRKLEVERYVEIPLTQAPGTPGRLPELAEAGQNLLRALPGPPDAIISAVPGEEISLRTLELPAAARKRIAEVLPFELEALLPYEPRDAVIDYQPIDTDPAALRVLVAAVLRKHVVAALEEHKQAGLEPRELAAGAAALDGLTNLLPELREEGPLLVLDMADHRTDLCFLRGGHCAMARTIAIGIEDMPAAAAMLQQELTRTLASFRTAGFEAPKLVLLSGAGALAEGSSTWLSAALGVRVEPLRLPSATVGDTQAGAAFGKAAALAARGILARRRINLRTGEFAPQQSRGQLLEHANLLVTCAVVVVMTMMFSLKARQILLADEQEALRSQLAQVTKSVFDKEIDDATEAEALIKNPRSNDPLPRFDAYDAMGALSAAIPESITHEVRRLRIEVADEKREGRMELQGALGSLAERDTIVGELEKHPCFKEIELGRTTPAGAENRISYQFESMVQCPGEVDPDEKKKTSTSKSAKTTEASE
jgi:general secretion pathway protein L